MDASSAIAPAKKTAGSPGSARVRMKLMTITPMITGTVCASLDPIAAVRPAIVQTPVMRRGSSWR